MGKINWGTTAEVLGGIGTKVAQKLGEKKQAKKQNTSYGSNGDYGGEADSPASPSSFKKGGKVKKTGMAKVHKGERVLTKKQQKKYCSGKR